jgi:hypothetical protein
VYQYSRPVRRPSIAAQADDHFHVRLPESALGVHRRLSTEDFGEPLNEIASEQF